MNRSASPTMTEPTPLGGLEGKIYVPTSLRSTLLGSLHASPGSGHPGSQRPLSILQARYWLPTLSRDVSQYVCGCSVCAISKIPHHLPAGKLVPLPIPRRPWSHVGVNFVTDLPNLEGFSCILVTVDRFSKACNLITLQGLSTALETVEALFHHIFRTFGIPEYVVSDHGPQFISRVWKAFFKLLDITVKLASGYHSQTNGQTERKIQEIGRYAVPTVMITSTAGTASSRGPSMHKIPSSKPPPASPCSSAFSATNPLCFPGQKNPPMFQL